MGRGFLPANLCCPRILNLALASQWFFVWNVFLLYDQFHLIWPLKGNIDMLWWCQSLCLYLSFETGSHEDQLGLELLIVLPPALKCSTNRHAPTCSGLILLNKSKKQIFHWPHPPQKEWPLFHGLSFSSQFIMIWLPFFYSSESFFMPKWGYSHSRFPKHYLREQITSFFLKSLALTAFLTLFDSIAHHFSLSFMGSSFCTSAFKL